MRFIKFFSMILLIASVLACSESLIPSKVFIFMGQSNMVGFAIREDFDDKYITVEKNERIQVFSNGQWNKMSLDKPNGPEVSFAYNMAKKWPNETIGILKVAISSTGIRAFIPDWDEKTAGKDSAKGPIYSEKVAPAIQQIFKQNPETKFMGAFWKQGGADMRSDRLAKGYAELLLTIVEKLRSDTSNPNLPFFIGTYLSKEQLSAVKGNPLEVKKMEKVRPASLKVIEEHHKTSELTSDIYIVNHGKLPTRRDQIHFNTEGQTILGDMFTHEFIETQTK